MIVEDEPSIYDMLMAMFQMWGIDGAAFVNGEEAMAWIEDVDALRFKGELPELALIDVRLPGALQGPAIGARLRRSPRLKDIAIVITSAYLLSVEEEQAAIREADADAYVRKPLPRLNEFKLILEKTLAERRARLPLPEAQPAAGTPETALPRKAPVKPRRPARRPAAKPKPRSK
jgi:CheY-like chemotaxis protein